MSINMFSPDVIEKLQYYVYKLIDPRDGQIFYIGKGKGNRVFAHVNDALNKYEGIDYTSEEEDTISDKIDTIRKIKNEGLEVIHVIVRYGMDEKTAFEVESALIDNTPGLSNEILGHAHDRGMTNAETIQNTLSAKEYDEPDFDYIIIKINETVCKQRGYSIYETVRSAWKVNLDKVKKYKYIFAVMNGVVKGVYIPEHWQEDSRERNGRFEFVGKEAPKEISDQFKNKRIPAKYCKRGMASPVLYSNNK